MSIRSCLIRANTVLHQVALDCRHDTSQDIAPGHPGHRKGRRAWQRAWPVIGEEFLYCVKAAGFADGGGGSRAGMRPPAAPALGRA